MVDTTIEVSKISQFNANVAILSQQQGTRLRSLVRTESMASKEDFFDSISQTATQKKVGRHPVTPLMEVPYSRRKLTLGQYHWNAMIDKSDEIAIIHEPRSLYAQNAAYAFGRTMDEEILDGFMARVYVGEKGLATEYVDMENANKVAAFDGTTATEVAPNVELLVKIKSYFAKNESVTPGETLNMAVNQAFIESLLGQDEITNIDYAGVKALIKGEVDSFMGINFVRTELIRRPTTDVTFVVTTGVVGSGGGTSTAADTRQGIAWANNGLILGVGIDVETHMDYRPDLSYAFQVYMTMMIGTLRMEEKKVLAVYYKDMA